jgi:hypothetical protein
MLSTYCQHCGSKNEYSTVKPKFCSHCGQSLNGELDQAKASAQSKPSFFARKPIQQEIHDEDGTDVYEVPNISKLEYDIEFEQDSTFSIGSIMPQQEKPVAKKKRGRPRKNG